MGKVLYAATTAFLLAGFAFSGSAEAQCWWNGYGWACPPAPYGYQSYGGNDDSAFGYYNRSRGTGPYDAFGAASHMGPDPGGGFRHMGHSNYGSVD
jgi:hypothetical protein